jgi:hypothetical protein
MPVNGEGPAEGLIQKAADGWTENRPASCFGRSYEVVPDWHRKGKT